MRLRKQQRQHHEKALPSDTTVQNRLMRDMPPQCRPRWLMLMPTPFCAVVYAAACRATLKRQQYAYGRYARAGVIARARFFRHFTRLP